MSSLLTELHSCNRSQTSIACGNGVTSAAQSSAAPSLSTLKTEIHRPPEPSPVRHPNRLYWTQIYGRSV